MADHDRAAVEEIPRTEALDLLQHHAFVGRIAFIADGEPVIMPVNYLADEASLVFCTAAGTKLSALGTSARVAFEVDESRPFDHGGWSVVVHGVAAEVTDPDELERLRRGPLKSWAVHPSAHWIRVTYDGVTGRRIPVH